MLKALFIIVAVVVVGILGLRLTHPLPDASGIAASTALPVDPGTELGAAVLPQAEAHPGKSGVAALADGRDALASRVLLARAAQSSLDVQYYIWQTDTTGWLLLDELRAAAERGVRVRLLLDDNGIPGLDDVLAALDDLPQVEVRLFNPFTMRQPKLLSYAFDFFRLNRRMHNKSMTADGVATILGGRNIGDIYFAYGEGTAYFDLDILGVGPVAADVSADFDRYWASASAYPAALILPDAPGGLERLATEAAAARSSVAGSTYLAAIESAPLISRILTGDARLEWTDVTLVSDDPAKGLGRAARENLLLGRLSQLVGEVEDGVDLVSAYLIPGRTGTDLLAGLANSGKRVRMVTNGLEATDVPAVHSAWMRYRAELIDAGVEVLELRARPDAPEGGTLAGVLMGSASSLHAKTFAIDGRRVFIGSFNFDPRSAALNTEMGVLVESPAIAAALGAALDRRETTYTVRRNARGDMEWVEERGTAEPVLHGVEPGATALRRAMVRVMSWLPIEWML